MTPRPFSLNPDAHNDNAAHIASEAMERAKTVIQNSLLAPPHCATGAQYLRGLSPNEKERGMDRGYKK